MTFDPQQAIRRAAMVARGLSNTVGPIPNAPGPALPQFDPKTFPGIHVKVAPHPNDRVKLQTGGMIGGIKAYHGSPHSFDRFDLGKIGTGEGAQAYGHGLYFAENEGVARGYRDALGEVHGILKTPAKTAEEQMVLDQLKRGVADEGYIPDPQQARDWINSAEDPFEPKGLHDAYDSLASRAPKGHMYEVNLNANPDHFLDWDKPLSEQHPIVQNVAHHADITHLKPGDRSRVLLERFRNNEENPDYKMTGSNLLTALNNDEYHSVATTKLLQKAGIPGIRYLDADSRDPNTSKPTSNYVVFDPDKIDIKHKYERGGEVEKTNISKQLVNKNTNSLTHSIKNAVNLAKSITPGRR